MPLVGGIWDVGKYGGGGPPFKVSLEWSEIPSPMSSCKSWTVFGLNSLFGRLAASSLLQNNTITNNISYSIQERRLSQRKQFSDHLTFRSKFLLNSTIFQCTAYDTPANTLQMLQPLILAQSKEQNELKFEKLNIFTTNVFIKVDWFTSFSKRLYIPIWARWRLSANLSSASLISSSEIWDPVSCIHP